MSSLASATAGRACSKATVWSSRGRAPRGYSRAVGTILGTSRTNPLDGRAGGIERVRETFERERLDVLIPIGGEDTLGVALRLSEEGLPIVGVPKTIDNDIGGTDVTFGFHTAVQIATDAIDRLAHDRRVAQPCDGGRGDGSPRRVDRHLCRHRRRRRCDPRARAALRRGGAVCPHPPPPCGGDHVLDRGGLRGRHTPRGRSDDAGGYARKGRVRARAVGGHRRGVGAGA